MKQGLFEDKSINLEKEQAKIKFKKNTRDQASRKWFNKINLKQQNSSKRIKSNSKHANK